LMMSAMGEKLWKNFSSCGEENLYFLHHFSKCAGLYIYYTEEAIHYPVVWMMNLIRYSPLVLWSLDMHRYTVLGWNNNIRINLQFLYWFVQSMGQVSFSLANWGT
jgi:hypothetical protein